MKAVVMLIGLIIATLGVVGIVTPEVLLSVSGQFATPTGLWVAALLRVVLGLLFLIVAPRSRSPVGLGILGGFVLAAGLVTPLVGVERARTWVAWWSEQAPLLRRAWGLLAIALGLFVFYAATPRRRALHAAHTAT